MDLLRGWVRWWNEVKMPWMIKLDKQMVDDTTALIVANELEEEFPTYFIQKESCVLLQKWLTVWKKNATLSKPPYPILNPTLDLLGK